LSGAGWGVHADPLPPLHSASEIAYPPFCTLDAQGRPDGFAVELFEASLQAMAREATFRIGDWADVRSWLERGEVKALPLVGRTPEREKLFDFTFPYMTLHGAIVVRAEDREIAGFDDLAGRRVGVMKGDNAEEFLRREPRNFEILTTPTFEQALRELSQGGLDAVVVQRLVAMRLISEHGLDNLRILSRPIQGFRQDFCFAVRKGDADTLKLLNEGLALAIADGTHRHLHSKWFAALELPSNRRILSGGDHNYPPFEFLNAQGEPDGFAVELIRSIGRQMGMEIEVRLGPWAQTVKNLEAGRLDAIQALFVSESRAARFDFTQPHSFQYYVGARRAGEGRIPESFEALAGLSLVAQEGDLIALELVARNLSARLRTVETQEDVVREVAKGRADCGLVMRIGARDIIKKHKWTHLRLGAHPIYTAEQCIAVTKGNKALLTQFNEGLRLLMESGEYRRIHEKWLGKLEREATFLSIVHHIAWVAIPLALVFLAVLLWNRVLQRTVTRRTAALRASEAQYRHLIENIHDIVYTLDTRGMVTFVSPSWTALMAQPMEHALGQPMGRLVHPEDLPRCREVLQALVQGEAAREGIEFRLQHADGTWRHFMANVARIENDQHVVTGVEGIAVDITQRKKDEERIRHLNRVLRAIRDVNQMIVREHDRNALIRQTCDLLVHNRGYVSTFIALTDPLGKLAQWAGAGTIMQSDAMRALLEQGELPPCCVKHAQEAHLFVIDNRRKECEACPLADPCRNSLSLFVRLRYDGDEPFGFMVMAMEPHLVVDEEERSLIEEIAGDLAFALHAMKIDEARRKSEQQRESLTLQLARTQKLEAIGRFAGGVAHDFNNLLMGIMGYAELGRDTMEPAHPGRSFFDEILSIAKRSTNLARQLLAFARQQPVTPKVLDLNDTLSGMLKLLRRLLGEDIDLTWMPGHHTGAIRIDPTQVDQILVNLCVNARDAIHGVGKITITTAMVRVDESYCAQDPEARPGDYAIITVSDTGCGIAPEVLERIFEPFFTTKAPGQGTGLGLSTVYGIVKQNGGFIQVDSKPGAGATFRIHLPHIEEREVPPEDREVPPALPRGTETILLAEDEPSLRGIAEKILSSLGYTVLVAANGNAALETAAGHPGTIHLLITDVIMPGMSGHDLATQLAEKRGVKRCLFMSGYTADIISRHGVLDSGIDFLQKPISRVQLANKVRDLLDRVG
jgi:PAS domain S-box-containing protein